MPAPFSLLAVCALASGTPVRAVSHLFAAARRLALEHDVSGVLAFDGAGFLLYLEGPHEAVAATLEGVEADTRYAEFDLLHHGTQPRRRWQHFLAGYALAEGLPPSEALRALQGPEAMQTFLALVADFDLAA